MIASNCCGATVILDTPACLKCGEHCVVEYSCEWCGADIAEENLADGGEDFCSDKCFEESEQKRAEKNRAGRK